MYSKLSFIVAFTVPFLLTGLLFATLQAAGAHGLFNGLYSADRCEAHTLTALNPIITVLSILFGFIPALCFTSRLMTPKTITQQEAAQEEQESTVNTLEVGQIITIAASNCRLRVKAIKNTIFAQADLSEYEYLLNVSF